MRGTFLADFLTVSKSTSRNVGGYFCHQFSDCHCTCWQIYSMSANLSGNVWGLFLLADFQTITKSASRNEVEFLPTISWMSQNQLADLLIVSKCNSINGVEFLPAEFLTLTIHAGRFNDCQQICQQKCRGSSAGINLDCHRIGGISASRFVDCYQFCWQNSWLSANLPAEWGWVFLPVDLLTVT